MTATKMKPTAARRPVAGVSEAEELIVVPLD
jgi:hypothetical protein